MNRFLRICHLCRIVFTSDTMQLLYTNDIEKDIADKHFQRLVLD
jgi:hypothetical protein